jgi:hypothetical protein
VIYGGILGLLIAVVYTLATGKIKLTKDRVTYGMPARAAALLGLVPVMLLCAWAVRSGGILNIPNGILLFLGALIMSVVVIYAVAWPFGEPPRA